MAKAPTRTRVSSKPRRLSNWRRTMLPTRQNWKKMRMVASNRYVGCWEKEYTSRLSMVRQAQYANAGSNDGVFVTGYRLHDPRDSKNKQDVEQAVVLQNADSGPPDSLKRIRHVLCESKVFAAYIFVYLTYLFWHMFLDIPACNLGMALAMRCADIFIWAAPFSFLFSVATLMHRQGRI